MQISVDSFDKFIQEIKIYSGCVFRGQSKEYGGLIPLLFRQDNGLLDISLLKSLAKKLYWQAYKVEEGINEAHRIEQKQQEILHNTNFISQLGRLAPYIALSQREDDNEDWGTPVDIVPSLKWSLPTNEEIEAWYEEYSDLYEMFGDDGGNGYIGHGFPLHTDLDEFVGLDWSYYFNESLLLALHQHYGVPTEVLDITFDSNVALWFATHQTQKLDEAGSILRYVPIPNERRGIVYVMDVPQNRLIDLRRGEKVPIAGLRGQRQCGGLVTGATTEDSDLMKYVVQKIYVEPSTFNCNHQDLALLTQKYLFPFRDEDVFFNVLLEAKYSNDERLKYIGQKIREYVL